MLRQIVRLETLSRCDLSSTLLFPAGHAYCQTKRALHGQICSRKSCLAWPLVLHFGAMYPQIAQHRILL